MASVTRSDVVLVSLLAMRDAIWTPCRTFTPGSPWAVNASDARTLYRAEGVPWTGRGSTEAKRKATQRDLGALVDAGFVERTTTGKKYVGCILTPRGERRAQRLANQPTGEDGVDVIDYMETLAGPDNMWIREDDILPYFALDFAEVGRVEQLSYLMDVMFPWVARGRVIVRSTVLANARYRFTDLADTDFAEDDVPGDEDTLERGIGSKVYDREYEEALANLKTAEPSDANNLGEIPLGCSWNYPNEYYVPSVHGAKPCEAASHS